MSDLFSILSSAGRALEAQRVGLDVTGQNIANVNTAGYSRRTVDFTSVPPVTQRSAGGGVDVLAIRAQRDRLIERRLQFETSGGERYAAVTNSLSSIESVVASSASSVDTRLNAFYDSWSRLALRPTDAVAREDVLLSGQALANSFNATVARIADLGRDADQNVLATVAEINGLTTRIAKLNVSLATTGGSAALQLQDEQQRMVGELSALTDIRVVARPDGGVDIDSLSGQALVIGNSAYSMNAPGGGANGYHAVTLGGDDLTASLRGGRLGGLLEVRDTLLPGYVATLDDQASALASAINTAHTAGFDLAGNAGEDFFTFSVPPQGNAGAAAALQVNPDVAADNRLVAAAGSAQPGDNQAARALAAIRDARIMSGGSATLTDSWGQLVATIGQDVRAATSERDVRGQIIDQIKTLRDQVSGVSLDEEALNLMKFQRAYEANARLFRAVDDALQVLFDSLGQVNMRVSYETLHRHAATALETASERLVDLQRQVSTGKRIDRASQDPGAAAAAIVERGRLASTDVYIAAGTSAQSRLTVTDTVLSDLVEQLSAAQVTVTAARGTTVSANQRQAYANQLDTLRDAMLRDMNTTFDGVYLFAGVASTTAPYAMGSNNVVSGYQGSAEEVSVDVDSGMEVAIGFNGEEIAKGHDADDLFVELDRAITAARSGDANGLDTAAAAMQRAFDRVSLVQSRVGASLQRIGDAQIRLGEASRSTTARLTALEDVNMASAISALTQADTVYRAALGAAGQMNRPSLMDYLR